MGARISGWLETFPRKRVFGRSDLATGGDWSWTRLRREYAPRFNRRQVSHYLTMIECEQTLQGEWVRCRSGQGRPSRWVTRGIGASEA